MRSLILSLLVLQLILPGAYSEAADRKPKKSLMCKNPKGKEGQSTLQGCSTATCGKVGKKAVCPQLALEKTVQENQIKIDRNQELLKEILEILGQPNCCPTIQTTTWAHASTTIEEAEDCSKVGIDYNGGDITSFASVLSAAACGCMCKQFQNLAAWTWGNLLESDPDKRGRCWCKSTQNAPSVSKARTSGSAKCPTAANCPTDCSKVGIDYNGGDITSFASVLSAADCGCMCKQFQNLAAWTWGNLLESDPDKRGHCWCKSTQNAPSVSKGRTSGSANCPTAANCPTDCSKVGIDYYGGDISSFASVLSAAACGCMCKQFQNLAAWTWGNLLESNPDKRGRCWCKSTQNAPSVSKARTSGLANCPSKCEREKED